jgi:hypothetical protein
VGGAVDCLVSGWSLVRGWNAGHLAGLHFMPHEHKEQKQCLAIVDIATTAMSQAVP